MNENKSTNSNYLFLEPITLGTHTLKNRVMMGSMHTGLEEKSLSRLAHYFEERAKGGVGLIITGGFAPNTQGWLKPLGAKFTNFWQIPGHKKITSRVQQHGAKICLQLLHAGRYAYHPFSVAPSAIKAVISPFKPKKMSDKSIKKTIQDFTSAAVMAKRGGYDGVEIMGSEGYLINQFLAPKTNQRTDDWGGDFQKRKRFALEIVKGIRAKLGDDFLLIYRISILDLVDNGCTFEEVIELAKDLEVLGVDAFNTGIGWHEAKVPTIATIVPQGHFADYTAKLKKEIKTPIIASNRINTPQIAQQILENDQADMVSMARPMLADPHWVNKASRGEEKEINICIACNQACLDHIFENKIASCLVNPQAAFETKLKYTPVEEKEKKTIAVIGGGVAGLSAAHVAALRGHDVTLFEKSHRLGGQFNLASQIPGKEEFQQTLIYFQEMLKKYHVKIELNYGIDDETLNELEAKFDHIILASGVRPRLPNIKGIDHQKVVSYPEAITNPQKIGDSVAIIGAGGIGFDVAELLTHVTHDDVNATFSQDWGIDESLETRGSLLDPFKKLSSPRKVYLLQRRDTRLGSSLAKTTGWIRRSLLKKKSVHMMNGVQYAKIDDKGLHIVHDGVQKLLEVDHIVICAGQESQMIAKASSSSKVTIIGGALKAGELDAKRAIREGAQVSSKI